MMSERLQNYLKTLRCVKRGKYHAVYYNPKNRLYEIWDRFEQCDWAEDKTEAIETMKYLDRNYISDLY